MNSRFRRIITVALPSHLILLVLLVTSQLLAQTAPAAPISGMTTQPSTLGEEVTIRAREQEKEGNTYRLNGDVEISFRNYILRAEHLTYNSDNGAVEATGNVVLDGGPHDVHLEAGHATYNVKSEDGDFYDVVGTFGTTVRGSTVVLTSNNPFVITGQEVQKRGRDRYIVNHGTITTCDLPTPKWSFNAKRIDVVAGEEAKVYHSSFRLHRIPVFYFPYAQHPLDNLGRESGFLLPSIGQSSSKGFIFGESVYWAINRSMDTTIGGEYFSTRGWSQRADFRARPTQDSSVEARFFSVLDRGNPTTHVDQGGQDVTLNGELNRENWRAAASIEYLSSYIFRLAFSESYAQAVNSEVKSVAFISRNQDGYSLNLMSARYQNFQITEESNQIKIIHAPTVEVSSAEQAVPHTPLKWSVDSAAEGVSRREPSFVTGTLVGRLDLNPRLALPLSWKGWDLRPEAQLRDTYYTQQQTPGELGSVGTPLRSALNRRALEGSVELRPPVLSKIFDREIVGRKLKHVIEPRLVYNYQTGIDRFQNIIRFDERDILSDSNEFEYSLVQRLYSKRRLNERDQSCTVAPSPADRQIRPGANIPGTSATPLRCEDQGSSTREIVSWEVKQKFFFDPTFGGALVEGQRNVFSSTADLSGIAFLTERRNWSPIVSRLRVLTSANTDVQWQLDYDTKKGRINSSTTLVDYRFGQMFVGASHAFVRVPGASGDTTTNAPDVFNQFRGLLGFGHPNKRGLSAGASLGYDQHFDYLQYTAVQTNYNWDCCGLSFEYRRFAVPSVRNENQFRFAFMLANIGTFGNLRRQERLY